MTAASTAMDFDPLARRRAKTKAEWLLHAAIYILVNFGLIAISLPGLALLDRMTACGRAFASTASLADESNQFPVSTLSRKCFAMKIVSAIKLAFAGVIVFARLSALDYCRFGLDIAAILSVGISSCPMLLRRQFRPMELGLGAALLPVSPNRGRR
ncbi:MAG: hypothetical protein LBH31_00675 [Burkholderiaceae bacterium]|jgi:hypothetical protein|nr:hypothetical protein [Burkholderiaceae bacterium]